MPNIQSIPTPTLFERTAAQVPAVVIVDPAGFVLGDPAGNWIGGL